MPGSDLWLGAMLPTEFSDGDRTKVTIEQLQQKAILTWQTFNVGKETDLTFDQKGNRDWIALNRVLDPSLAPSRILGSIKADGSVYVINRNGIIFGGTSQINVGTLLASSLDIKGPNTNLIADRDQTFLNGLFASGTAIFQSRKLPDATGALVIPDTIEGDVVVEAGAMLRSRPASGSDDGGRIMLFGPNVHNAGSIMTADGQAVLAAGRTITATVGTDQQLAFTAAPAVLFSDPFYSNPAYAGEPAYKALNTGVISADRGAIIMLGTLVEQGGVLTATTSINRPGTISLAADGRLTLSSGSSILMDADAMLDAEGQEVTAPAFNGGLTVALKGSSVDVQADSFIRAPSGKITIDAIDASALAEVHSNVPDDNGRIFLAPGSAIDVSGLTDILVPIERAIIKVQPRGQEFADSPLQRDTALRGQTVYVDSRITGVREDGVAWIGTPLLDASGYVGLIQKSTREYLVTGGSVAINGQRDIVVPQGATVNISGGYVRYTGGVIPTTRLIGADGHLYDIANADPMMKYIGVYGGFTRHSERWGVTETWTSPFARTSRYEPGYYEGAAAGSLNLTGLSTLSSGVVYFDGKMIANIVNGERQIAHSDPAEGGRLSITSQSNIIVSADGQRLPSDVGLDSPLPTGGFGTPGLGRWSWLSADAVSDIGLGSIQLTTLGGLVVADDAVLDVVPGGHIGLTGGVIRVDGKLRAPAGSIELRTTPNFGSVITLPPDIQALLGISLPGGVPDGVGRLGNITLSAGASLSTRGLWVDDRAALSAYGAKFVDGGAITIRADASPVQSTNAIDNTGDIVLRVGSIIDASSGGHVLINGTWASKSGVPLGNGGDIAILSYAGDMYTNNALQIPLASPPTRASMVLDGTLSSYGFTQGGTLTLRAGSLVIGPGERAPGRVVLGHDFFHDNSFGGYALSSVNDTTILDGTADMPAIIAPRQLNYVGTDAPFAPGSDPFASGAIGIGLLSDFRRRAVNFAVNGNTYYNNTTKSVVVNGVQVPDFGIASQLILGANTKILADTGATVRLSTGGTLIVAGEIRAPAGTIEIVGTNAAKVYNSREYFDDRDAVWLTPSAVLDASGTVLLDDMVPANGSFGLPRLGRVLDGGTVTVSHARGYVIGMEGATIDVSGASGELDLLRSSSDLLSGHLPATRTGLAPVNPYTRQTVWSDGGAINLEAAQGLNVDATLKAGAGAPEGRGGALTYRTLPGATSFNVAATLTGSSLSTAPAGLTPGARIPFATYSGKSLIRTDLIAASGADSLIVTGSSNLNIEDGVALSLPGGSIRLDAATIALVPAQLAPGETPSPSEPSATLSASHIALNGISLYYTDLLTPAATNVRGRLSFTADTIDLDGHIAFNNLKTLELTAALDLRLLGAAASTPWLELPFPLGQNPFFVDYYGSLNTPGDITITAGQVYPGTAQKFTIRSTGADGTIRFAQSGMRPGAPLSAGGRLQITAAHIVQGGTIRAPQGSITFGETGKTQTVEFLLGSLTSVSLEGLTVPYGRTLDEYNWVIGNGKRPAGFAFQSALLEIDVVTPPDKLIAVNGASVTMGPGAVLNLSAGGDLIGPEFVPGTGGSRDVLALTDRQVYAILPRYSGTRAPVDKTAASDATSYGEVYLTGVPGLANGYYTLLPPQYAVLPGAYRVVARPGADPRAGGTLPDGTVIAAGFFASSDHTRRDAAVTTFEVQSRAVWGQYSEYRLTSANAFFGNLEVLHADVAPYRPQDAGRLVISATNQLVLQAQTKFATVEGGRGGRVDIGGRDLQILGQGETAQAGYLGLFASDLTNLKAESILLGGTRSTDGTGQLITAVANSILVSNDEASALVAPELLFAIKTDPSSGDPHAGNGLVFEAGSVVIGEGTPIQTVPLITSGDGALVRVSGGALTAITNRNAPTTSTARVLVAAGAQLIGKGSIALQSMGDVLLQPGAILTTNNIDVLTRSISLVGEGGTAPASGFILDTGALATLGNIRNVTLSSATTIDAYGDVAIRLARGGAQPTSLTLNAGGVVGHGGALTLEAGRVVFSNTLGGTSTQPATSGAAFTIAADEIVFGAGNSRISGYASLDAGATTRVLAQGKGSMDFGAMPVTLRTPLITTAATADQEWRSTGAIALLGGTGSTPVADGLGGLLAVLGSTVSLDTAIVMPSGGMTLEASTGDIALGASARLIATGHSKQIFDKRIDTGGGAIILVAAHGNIVSASGAVLDVSASPLGGDAGAITLQAEGRVDLPGTMRGTAATGFEGGRFTLHTGSAVALDPLATVLMSNGFDGGVDVRSGQGDLTLTQSLVATSVALTADGGLVSVSGLIDASGKKGGRIDLYGRDGVTLASGGRLVAIGSDPDKRGGDIFIGTAGTGVITLASGSSIDVPGGTLAGLSDGTLNLRAPIINGGVNVTVDSTIRGARDVVLEAYRVFDTTSSAFDGIIDPLGLYDSAGNRLASGVNQAHLDFYNGELVSFVQNPGVNYGRFAHVANFRGRAGIELRNSDTTRNRGDILVVSDWDFGAGSINPVSGRPNLTWRTGVEPGVLTLRAAGNVDVRAIITDGFFNTSSMAVPHAADLMPASWGDSWSYHIVGGADLASVNPKALLPLAALAEGSGLPTAGRGDVTISGHRTFVVRRTTYELPNMIRTGTGFIDIAAGRDVALRDTLAPGVIYTAGRPSADLPAANLVNINGSLVPTNPSGFVKPGKPNPFAGNSGYVVNQPVWPEAAGDISIVAQRDVIGLQDVTYPTSDGTGAFLGQLWSPWLIRTGLYQPNAEFGVFNPNEAISWNAGSSYLPFGTPRQTATWINFGSFNQGVMSVGGDIEIIAGRDVSQFSASLPTTVRVSGGLSALDPVTVVHVTGGGDLMVRSGRDILSGAYYVGKGEGDLQAGGSFRAGWVLKQGSPDAFVHRPTQPVSTILGVADSRFDLRAGGALDLGGVFSPTDVHPTFFWGSDGVSHVASFNEYSKDSGVTLTALSGDVALKSFESSGNWGLFVPRGAGAPSAISTRTDRLLSYEDSHESPGSIWPASLRAHALSGRISVAENMVSYGIELYPSPTGQLELIAERNVDLWGGGYGFATGVRMTDVNPYAYHSVYAPTPYGTVTLAVSRVPFGFTTYSGATAYPTPDYNVALTHLDDEEPARIYSRTGTINGDSGKGYVSFTKPARIEAGLDIVDLNVTAQNMRADDVTSVIAGRDIYASVSSRYGRFTGTGMSINVGGPGTIYVEAGRNIGPLLSSRDTSIGGIVATGPANNRSLPREGADIFVVLGVANGKDPDAMITRYLDPAGAEDVPYRYTTELAAYLNELRRKKGEDERAFSPTEAIAAFRALGENEQTAFLYDVLFGELQAAADPIKNPDNYGEYDRSYAAIHTLFPPRLGYPDTDGEKTKPSSGSLDLRGASIQTQFGGNISIVAPVGRIVVGSQSATPLSNNPAVTGILTLRGGDIRILAEDDVLVHQSRIFTEQGGDIVMWSSNGDLNAGKGAKTSASYPPLLRAISLDGYTSVDPAGLVTGAGIGALRTIVGQSESTVYLIAPHGTVDLGDAGLRSTGAVNVAALRILNAANIQAMGPVTGIPTFQMPSSAGLLEAGNTAGAAVREATTPKAGAAEQPSVIIVEVIGFGGGDGEPESDEERRCRSEGKVDSRCRSQGKQGYNPKSAVQYAGAGPTSDAQKKELIANGNPR